MKISQPAHPASRGMSTPLEHSNIQPYVDENYQIEVQAHSLELPSDKGAKFLLLTGVQMTCIIWTRKGHSGRLGVEGYLL